MWEPFGGWANAHWLPGIAIQLGLLPYFVLPGAAKLDFLYGDAGKWTFLCIYLFIYLQIAAYVLLCERALRRHRAQLAATEEKEELRADLGWIKVVCYGFAAFVALDGIVPHLRITPPGASYALAMALYLTIVDVAIACGYNNRNPFYNSFRRFVGTTPTEFRQRGTESAV